jgi:hypothetical protein
MSDDHPTDDGPTPLEYFHSSEPGPLHPVLLTLCTIAGSVVGGGAMAALGGGCLAAVLNQNNGGHWKLRIAGAAAILGSLAIFAAESFIFRRDRGLALEQRRRGGRFFFIGFIIGCGICCLLEGLCFSVFGWAG